MDKEIAVIISFLLLFRLLCLVVGWLVGWLLLLLLLLFVSSFFLLPLLRPRLLPSFLCYRLPLLRHRFALLFHRLLSFLITCHRFPFPVIVTFHSLCHRLFVFFLFLLFLFFIFIFIIYNFFNNFFLYNYFYNFFHSSHNYFNNFIFVSSQPPLPSHSPLPPHLPSKQSQQTQAPLSTHSLILLNTVTATQGHGGNGVAPWSWKYHVFVYPERKKCCGTIAVFVW